MGRFQENSCSDLLGMGHLPLISTITWGKLRSLIPGSNSLTHKMEEFVRPLSIGLVSGPRGAGLEVAAQSPRSSPINSHSGDSPS